MIFFRMRNALILLSLLSACALFGSVKAIKFPENLPCEWTLEFSGKDHEGTWHSVQNVNGDFMKVDRKV